MHPSETTTGHLEKILEKDKARELKKQFTSTPIPYPEITSTTFSWLLEMAVNRIPKSPQHAAILEKAGYSERETPDDGTAQHLTKSLAAKVIEAFKTGTSKPPISFPEYQRLQKEMADRSKSKLAHRSAEGLEKNPLRRDQPQGKQGGPARAETLQRPPHQPLHQTRR